MTDFLLVRFAGLHHTGVRSGRTSGGGGVVVVVDVDGVVAVVDGAGCGGVAVAVELGPGFVVAVELSVPQTSLVTLSVTLSSVELVPHPNFVTHWLL